MIVFFIRKKIEEYLDQQNVLVKKIYVKKPSASELSSCRILGNLTLGFCSGYVVKKVFRQSMNYITVNWKQIEYDLLSRMDLQMVEKLHDTGHERPISKVMFSYTGDLLFSSCKGGKMCAWDPDTGKLLQMYEHKVEGVVITRAIWDFDVIYDGSRLIVATSEGINIFDVETGNEIVFLNIGTVIKSVAWNKKPDDQWSFAIARDNFDTLSMAIVVYKVEQNEKNQLTCKPVLEITDLPSKCVKLDYGMFDETLISFHENGLTCVWNLRTGMLVKEAKLFQKVVTSVDFSKDRAFCLCASHDRTAKLIYTLDLSVVQTYTTDRPLNACSILPVDKSEDPAKARPHIILAGGQSAEEVTTTKTQEAKCEVLLMNTITADVLGTIATGFSPVNTITFMRDGSGFVLGAEEGNIRLYRFDPSYYTNPKLN